MTTGEMLHYTNQLKKICSIKSVNLRDAQLANLMTELEIKYKIPLIRDEEFEQKNPLLMQLYRTISELRSL